MANLNLEQILDLFQNGPRRYEEDPEFKAVIDSLKMGLGVYGVLDHVLGESTRIKEKHRSLIFKHVALENQIEMQQTLIDQHVAEIQKLKDEVASYKDANDALADRCEQFDNYLGTRDDNPGGRSNY